MKYAIVEISGRQFGLKQVNIMISIESYRIRNKLL
jgi:hypothetical protein